MSSQSTNPENPAPVLKATETMTPKEQLAQLAKAALKAADGRLAAADLTPDQREIDAQMTNAAIFAAAAYENFTPKGGGEVIAMKRAFLIALFDPSHEDLDYLRADPSEGAKARAEAEIPYKQGGADGY